MWATNGGVWARAFGRDGEEGTYLSATYTEIEQQQWIHVAFSIDNMGTTHLRFNASIRATVMQPYGVAENLNLASDMFLGHSPMSGLESDR